MSGTLKSISKGGPAWDRLVAIEVEGDRLLLRGRSKGKSFEVILVDFEHATVTWLEPRRGDPRFSREPYITHVDRYAPGSVRPIWRGEE